MKFVELEGKVPSRSLAAIWPPTRAARAGCRNETPTPRKIRPGVPYRELAGKLAGHPGVVFVMGDLNYRLETTAEEVGQPRGFHHRPSNG